MMKIPPDDSDVNQGLDASWPSPADRPVLGAENVTETAEDMSGKVRKANETHSLLESKRWRGTKEATKEASFLDLKGISGKRGPMHLQCRTTTRNGLVRACD
jgi:hypothetical protein